MVAGCQNRNVCALGVYSLFGKREWVRFNEQIPKEEYEALAIDSAQNFSTAGRMGTDGRGDGASMRHGLNTMTALWDSAGSYEQFHRQNRIPQDFVAEYAEAAVRQDSSRILLFPMDWRFPGYFDPEGLPENAALMKNNATIR